MASQGSEGQHDASVERQSAPGVLLAALMLVLLPLLAVVIKATFVPGWFLVIALWYGYILLPGYVLQLVIAIGSMMRPRGLLRRARGAWRAISAAWLTSLGVLGVGFFLVDGGDDGRSGSALTEVLGVSGSGDAKNFSMLLALFCGYLWIGGWIWLVVEWVVQLVAERRARRAL